jgi:hypothetical protein
MFWLCLSHMPPHTLFPYLSKIFPREFQAVFSINLSSSRKQNPTQSGVTWLLEGAPSLCFPRSHSSLLSPSSFKTSCLFFFCAPCFYMDSKSHFCEMSHLFGALCFFVNHHLNHPLCPSLHYALMNCSFLGQTHPFPCALSILIIMTLFEWSIGVTPPLRCSYVSKGI